MDALFLVKVYDEVSRYSGICPFAQGPSFSDSLNSFCIPPKLVTKYLNSHPLYCFFMVLFLGVVLFMPLVTLLLGQHT